jgi:hypothetical protein
LSVGRHGLADPVEIDAAIGKGLPLLRQTAEAEAFCRACRISRSYQPAGRLL